VSPSKYLAVTYTPTSVLVEAAIPGDTNFDGQVDATDLGVLATNWQLPGSWVTADFNGSGIVDVNDLSLMALNWHAGVSFAEAAAALGLPGGSVPEPAMIGVAPFLIMLGARRRRLCLTLRRP
jgi:hypothetical protein